MSTRFFVKMAAAIALSVFAFAACDEDSKGPKDPNYNEDGGNGKPAETEAVTPGLSVSAAYLGDYFKNGYNDYVLVFTIGETDKDGYFVNGGSKLSLDILTSNGGPTLFPEGVYTITNANHNSAGILPSPEADAEEPLTFYYFEQDKDNHWKLPLEAATLDVKVSGAQYTIKVDFSSDEDDFSWLYKGTLSIENKSQSGGDDEEVEGPDGDYDFKADMAYASNVGRSWDDPDDPNDTDDWELQFYNSNDEEEWMSVEIVAPAASNIAELPTGNFVIPADFYEVEYPAAGSLLPPYYYNYVWYGTYYAIGEEIWYYADSGSLKISKSGDDYTFELSFRDNGTEDYDPATVTMTYTGKVEVNVDDYWDGSDDEEDDSMLMMKKAAPSTKMKMVRRNTAKRQSKAELKVAAIR